MLSTIIILSSLGCAMTYADLTVCTDDTSCLYGYYCATDASYCVPCFKCEDFNRKPGHANKCIKTVGDCGPCLDGLVADSTGDLRCLPPNKDAKGMPAYLWAIIIGILLLVVFSIVVVTVYLFRENVAKISSRAIFGGVSVGGGGGEGELSVRATAPAPDPPPPYNPYSPLRPDSPPGLQEGFRDLPFMDTRDDEEETAGPFIKRAPSSRRPQPRESDGNQNARVFKLPNYVRHRSPTSKPKFDDDDDHDNNFSPIQDEETTESTWTPTIESNNTNGEEGTSAGGVAGDTSSEASALPALLATARDTTLIEPPAKKAKEHVNDTNNNGNAGAISNGNNNNNSTSHQNAQTAAMYLNIQVNNYPRNVLHYN